MPLCERPSVQGQFWGGQSVLLRFLRKYDFQNAVSSTLIGFFTVKPVTVTAVAFDNPYKSCFCGILKFKMKKKKKKRCGQWANEKKPRGY